MVGLITILSFLSLHGLTPPQAEPVAAYTEANIERTIAEHLAFVRACYVAHPPRPDGTGHKRLRLTFSLAADGKVAETMVKHDSLDSARATECVQRIARTWRFPAPPAAGAQLEYTFRFQ